MYVDESGDPGLVNSPTNFFALSGIVVHELRWLATLDAVVAFRRDMRRRFGLKLSDEIHAGAMMQKSAGLRGMPKHTRLTILRELLAFEATLVDINIINVVVDEREKTAAYDPFEKAWQALVQRFHNTLGYGNFPGPKNPNERGMIIVDQTDEPKLRRLVRRMRRYNMVPSKLGPGSYSDVVDNIVEDPVHRNSAGAFMIQLADVNSYFLMQYYQANKFIRKQGARKLLEKLDPVLCKVARPGHRYGIVEL